MKFGLDVATAGEYAHPQVLADLAVEAEAAGWDGFFLWDVVYSEGDPRLPVVDPWIALAAIAMRTDRIGFGALLTPLARYRPWQVARQTVALDHLSHGRLIFGAALGYQEIDFAPFGEEYNPRLRAERLDESLEILSGLWLGGPFGFHGKHYQVEAEAFLPKPVQSPRIPVWIGGYWPNRKPLDRAARWDGLYLGSRNASGDLVSVEDVKNVVNYVKSQRARSDPCEIAFCDSTFDNPSQGALMVQRYFKTGVTWYLEEINSSVGPLNQTRARIRSGPPKA